MTWSSPKQPVFKKIQQQKILWQHDKTYNPRFPQIQINKAPLEMDNLSILQSSVNSPLLKKDLIRYIYYKPVAKSILII